MNLGPASRRVAFVTNLCPHYCRPLFELLDKRLEIDFFFFSEGHESWVSPDLRLERGDFRTVDVARKRIFGEPVIPGLPRELHRGKYESVVKCLNGRLMVPYTYAVSRALDLPLVLWTGMWSHPTTAFHRLTRSLTKRIYEGADAIVAYGDHVRGYLIEEGIRAEKVYVSPQSVDATRFDQVLREPSEPPEVLYVGQFEARKGIHDLLDATEVLRGENMTLTFIGSGELKPIIEQRSLSDKRVRVEDWLTPDELPGRLSRATCLVLPSITTPMGREPWGLVVNEAMCANLPVVATDAVGAAAGGLVRNARNGLVVREGDVVALARAIRSLVGNRRWAHELGAHARLDVTDFRYEVMADGFEAAIEHAISARDRGRRVHA